MPERRRSREIEDLVEAFALRLTAAVESVTSTRARVLSEEYLRSATTPPSPTELKGRAASQLLSLNQPNEPENVEPSPTAQGSPPRALRVRPRALRPAPAAAAKVPAAIDPEEQRRTAELARLRAILRPTAPAPMVMTVNAPTSPRAAEGDDSLQAIEDQIRDQIPTLAGLSQSRYTARIAAWVGRVRLHQSGPDSERTRIASRMLVEKLRSLAWSMEAGTIEALNTSWSTRNWERYIQENEVIATGPARPPPLQPEPGADVDVWSTGREAGSQA